MIRNEHAAIRVQDLFDLDAKFHAAQREKADHAGATVAATTSSGAGAEQEKQNTVEVDPFVAEYDRRMELLNSDNYVFDYDG